MKRADFLRNTGFALAASALQISAHAGNVSAENVRRKILPPRLRPGDTVALTAPAGAVFNPEGIEKGKSALEAFGFRVRLCDSLYRKHGYFAGTDEERAKELMQLFEDDNVHGIVAVRGGWGCARILPLLDFEKIAAHPKVISGFSDITTLLLAIHAKTGIVTFHGPVGASSWSELTNFSFKSSVMDAEMPRYKESSAIVLSKGKAEGELLGGNLTVLCSLIGTPWLPDFTDSILFLEETEEEPYSIDRMLTQLKQSGMLSKAKGVVFGQCRKCEAEEPEKSFTFDEVMKQHFSGLDIPVISNYSFGHTVDKYTFPLGSRARISTEDRSVEMLEASVK
ncbi:MAG: LD-carboxypeptidase [Bacteroidia bacterium]